jgi:hypothetical protein
MATRISYEDAQSATIQLIQCAVNVLSVREEEYPAFRLPFGMGCCPRTVS